MTATPTPCEVCGATYKQPLEITLGGKTHSFDCFECAIHALAPPCTHCKCRVIGHGVERDGMIYCSHHCSEAASTTAASA
jgi:hypothetical protein